MTEDEMWETVGHDVDEVDFNTEFTHRESCGCHYREKRASLCDLHFWCYGEDLMEPEDRARMMARLEAEGWTEAKLNDYQKTWEPPDWLVE
ncbi:MAG TPA: hypothetical protein VN577_09945 [Terriglobales bacterium]|nr:hypothetical protein [Terriglobales bacterium]